MNKSLKLVYFSPTDSTKYILHKIASEMNSPINEEYNLTNFEYKDFTYFFKEDDLVLLGSPVYGARIPKSAKNRFVGLKGNNTKVVLVLTYGDVHYDDSMIEFYDIMKNKGFEIIGMGIFVSRHNVIKSVGLNRPNGTDYEILKMFTQKILENINGSINKKFEMKSTKVFGENNKLPIKPKGNKNCKKCGLCIKLCPENAIEEKNPRKTDRKKCICCMRFVKYCPYKARNLSAIIYFISGLFLKFMKKIKYSKENKSEIIY